MKIKTFEVEKWYSKYEFSSKYNLSASGVNSLSIKNITNENDSPATGNNKLLEILSKIYSVSTSEILVTNGAIEAIFLSQMALLNPNDKIIVLKPTYPALYQMAESLGVKVIEWKLKFEDDFKPNILDLEKLFEENNPKLLVINFPNNPTGVNLTKLEIEKICNLAKKYDCYLLSDEVYKGLDSQYDEYNTYKTYSKSIVISSLSKTYGLPGLRIGWIIANDKFIEECSNLRCYATLCNNNLGEFFAEKVLENEFKYRKESLNILSENYKILEEK